MANSLGTGGRGNDLAPESGNAPSGIAGSPLERASNPMLSLDALRDASLHSPPIRNSMPDSGKIVLSNLSKSAPVGAPAILDALPALGSAQSETAQKAETPAPAAGFKQRGLGIGIAIAGIVIAGAILYSLRTPSPAQATTPAATASAQAAEPSPTATVTVVASTQPTTPPVVSNTPKSTAPKTAASKKTQAVSEGDNPYAGETPPPPAEPTQPAAPPPKPPNPCGCAAEDLKCNMDCAVKGKK